MASVLLICAVVASLAAGIFVAQALVTVLFHVFRIHARQIAAGRAIKAVTVPTLQS